MAHNAEILLVLDSLARPFGCGLKPELAHALREKMARDAELVTPLAPMPRLGITDS